MLALVGIVGLVGLVGLVGYEVSLSQTRLKTENIEQNLENSYYST